MKITEINEMDEEALQNIEIDRVQLATGCPVCCIHCSRDPKTRLLEVMDPKEFRKYVIALRNKELFSRYLLTDADSEPFLNEDIAEIARILYGETGRRFYFLTSGLPMSSGLIKNAREICSNPEIVERVSITISHFPLLAQIDLERYIRNMVRTIREFATLCAFGKLVLSPQYVNDGGAFYSETATLRTFRRIVVNVDLDTKRIVFPRPIIGMGRAKSRLNVTDERNYRIEAETPAPSITERNNRGYSGMITIGGQIMVCKSRRGSLNAIEWRSALEVFGRRKS